MRHNEYGVAFYIHPLFNSGFPMKYDFDTCIDRHGTDALKWDVAEGELPMWVADMDFRTSPEIIAALEKRVSHGIYGYSILPDEWADAYCYWWKSRYDFELLPEKLIFCTGVVPAISSIVQKLTTPNENVVIQTPVYNIFFNSILNHGRRVLESPLCYDGKTYRIDFEDLESKLALGQTTLMILCNPHNPVGKVWDRDTLLRIGHLCAKHHVTVISDEIHADLTNPGIRNTPFASVSPECADISISCFAPTKSFNIAGLQSAAVYVPNENLHHKVWRGLNTDEVAEPNAFAVRAAIAAYKKGAPWLDALRQYLYENKCLVEDYLQTHLPRVHMVPSQATYLLWLDISAYTKDSREFCQRLRKETGLFVSAGNAYGGNGHHFLRLNVACPKSRLLDGLNRLEKGIRRISENA